MSEQPPKKDDPDDLADLLAALDEVTRKEKTGELARLNAEEVSADEASPEEATPDEPSTLDDSSTPGESSTPDEPSTPEEPPEEDSSIERAHMTFGAREDAPSPPHPASRFGVQAPPTPSPTGELAAPTSTDDSDAGEPAASTSTDDSSVEKPATPKGLFTEDQPAAPRQTGPAIRPTPPPPPRSTTSTASVEVKYRYRISLVLSPELEMQLNAARQSVSIPVARPGIFALQEDFESSDIDAVQEAIKTWAAQYLPIDVEVERVVAEVVGEQRYIAGFALEPAQKINAAQQALASALANNIRPAAQDALPFTPRLPVSDHTPAADFPRLIHELQKRFESSEWLIEAVELLRVPEDDERWEVVQKF